MGIGLARHQLVHRINTAFHRDNIAASARRVAPLGPEADAFDIIHGLRLFRLRRGTSLAAYRDSLPIPELNKTILKQAFQTSVQSKKPLTLGIVHGPAEAIQVTVTRSQIHVILTRTD